MKYVIIGDGFIGNYLAKTLPGAVIIQNKIYDKDFLKALVSVGYPSHIIINCAGKTGRPNVDACEQNKDVVFGANVGLPVMIAEAMKEIKSYWVHIGSGCVYNGYDTEYTEEDEPNFTGSFYAKTKKWSQDILKDFDEPLVLRIRMPVLDGQNARCYINKVLSYAKAGYPIFNLKNSMTYLPDMAAAIMHLTEKGSTGEYNLVNRGALSPTEVLDLYRKYVGGDMDYKQATYEEVRATLKADRSNCILSAGKLEAEGFEMPYIGTRVTEVMKAWHNDKVVTAGV